MKSLELQLFSSEQQLAGGSGSRRIVDLGFRVYHDAPCRHFLLRLRLLLWLGCFCTTIVLLPASQVGGFAGDDADDDLDDSNEVEDNTNTWLLESTCAGCTSNGFGYGDAIWVRRSFDEKGGAP